jgi:hypothetical protein
VVVVLEIEDQVDPPSVEDSQFKILPVCPLNVKDPLLEPVQTVALPLTDPPTVAGSTVMIAGVEFAAEQDPFCTTARYQVVAVRFR